MSRRTMRLLLTMCLTLMLLPVGVTGAGAAPGDCDALPSDPAAIPAGLTNMGFETGVFAPHWRVGATVDAANAPVVTGADQFATPFEGSFMARVGQAGPDVGTPQVPGMNELCQDFVVTDERETFVFNIFTYDYTGYDDFHFSLRVTDPATGQVLGAYQQGAWGEGTELKTSGWTGVTLDLTGRVGDTVRLRFSAGGTADDLFPFWVYLDSGDLGAPPILAPIASVTTASGSVMTDPLTGQITVTMPWGSPSDLTIATTINCPDETMPTAVTLLYNGQPHPMQPTVEGGSTYSATIPGSSIGNGGVLSVQAICSGTTYVTAIGRIQLYDPSGIVTDAVTGQPVVGATVTLYKVDGWTPKQFPGDTTPKTCQSHLSKAPGAPWDDPAATEDGVPANPYSGEISPAVNPFITNAVGYYGWDVALGCWYVVVEADGYQTLTSPMVGVPPEVTDLDLQLVPDSGFGALRAQLDALVGAGGIKPELEGKIRHALEMAELWLANPRQFGPALSHLDRAVRLLEWQADVVDKGKPNQGEPAGLRALAAQIRAFEEALRAAGPPGPVVPQ